MEVDQLNNRIVVSLFGAFSSEGALGLVLTVCFRLSLKHSIHCQIIGDSLGLPSISKMVDMAGMTEQTTLFKDLADDQLDNCIAETDIAVFLPQGSTKEIMSVLPRVMAAGIPAIIPDQEGITELPNNATLKIEQDECAGALLCAYIEALIEDSTLRARIGANARSFAAHANATPNARVDGAMAFVTQPGSNGRTRKVAGVDYKQGAMNYASNLAPSDNYHLFTKPFYNLKHRHFEKYSGESLDADTHRHFCDFANMAVALALPAGSRILDVGCGSGWLSEYFARFGYDVTGMDISTDLIEIAKDRLARVPYNLDHESHLRCRFITHDIESSPLDETFDALICYDSLHHFEDEKAVVRHLHEMLEDGGLFFVMEGARPPSGSPNEDELIGVMQKYAILESPFSRNYLQSLLRNSGFAVIGDYASVNGLFERELVKNGTLHINPSAFNYILCKKMPAVAEGAHYIDSRHPGVLKARFTVLEEPHSSVRTGARFRIVFEVENSGDTIWIVGQMPFKGSVRFGLKLLDDGGSIVDEIHGEPILPRALAPGEKVRLTLDHRAPLAPGEYIVKLDLLDQDICWFEQSGSEPLTLKLTVRT